MSFYLYVTGWSGFPKNYWVLYVCVRRQCAVLGRRCDMSCARCASLGWETRESFSGWRRLISARLTSNWERRNGDVGGRQKANCHQALGRRPSAGSDRQRGTQAPAISLFGITVSHSYTLFVSGFYEAPGLSAFYFCFCTCLTVYIVSGKVLCSLWINQGENVCYLWGLIGDCVNLQAEARLAARRQARAEAREIRMRELERQQKEAEENADKVFDMCAGTCENRFTNCSVLQC